MRQFLLLILCTLAIAGCSRSPAEQLAYLHAEEQYQINMERSARYRQSLEQADGESQGPIIITSRPAN
ncbi:MULTISPECIES: hypothetical protein [unclassified Herbaspirillum]|uniref:hypothetical protein n=1 Tax=unclassified Herbaspirillum TaxID=2624150 RepID=UPI00383BB63B